MRAHEHVLAEDLLDYADESADEATAARVQAHLHTGCLTCAGELAFWRRLLAAVRHGQALEPPEEAVERAIWIAERKEGRRGAPWLTWQEQSATAEAPGPVVRHGAVARIQLLFTADGTDVDLSCERERAEWAILGQALSQDGPEVRWTVAAIGAAGHSVTTTDAYGEFCLEHLAADVYHLILRGPGRTIVLAPVQLAAATR